MSVRHNLLLAVWAWAPATLAASSDGLASDDGFDDDPAFDDPAFDDPADDAPAYDDPGFDSPGLDEEGPDSFDDDVVVEEDDDFDLGEDFGEVHRDDKKGKSKGRTTTATDEEEPDDLRANEDDDPDWDAPADPDLRDHRGFEDDPAEDFVKTDHLDVDAFDEPGGATSAAAPLDDDDPVEDLTPKKKAPPAPAPRPPEKSSAGPANGTVFDLDIGNKTPLSDNFPGSVVGRDIDSVVIELPVLVARGASDRTKTDYWLVAEIKVAGKKVGETRHLVTGSSVADLGPTVVWVKSNVPVSDTRGVVEVNVSRLDGEGEARALFSRKVDYKL